MGVHDHDDDAPMVRGGLRLLIDDEPPFGTANAAAVDDAMRRGRRRRVARTVAGGIGVAGLVAAAAVGVVKLQPQVVESALQPAAPQIQLPPVPDNLPEHDELVPVVQKVAASAEASADVTVLPELHHGPDYVAAAVAIETDAGVIEASVSVESPQSENSLETSDETCELRPCEQLFRGETDGAWAYTYGFGTRDGRETLSYVIEAQYGLVAVRVDNYTAQGEGTKVVGPTWNDVGFDAEAIRQVVADSGLLDWSPDH